MSSTVLTRRTPLAIKLGIVPVLVAVLLLGLYFLTGKLAHGYWVSIIFSAIWITAVALVAGKLVKSRPDLRWIVRITTMGTGLGIAAWFLVTTFSDKTVIERVPVATATASQVEGQGGASARRVNVLLTRGAFRGLAESPDAEGTASVIRLPSGRQVLTLNRIDISNGPDLRVQLASGDGNTLGSSHRDLGGLKGNKGTQQYKIAAGVDATRYRNVVVWCRAFSVGFAVAPLTRA